MVQVPPQLLREAFARVKLYILPARPERRMGVRPKGVVLWSRLTDLLGNTHGWCDESGGSQVRENTTFTALEKA
ncbi:hypothetical protein POX_a00413 [Penicillium oxalicum]|uniref:hypothetical protein n=1 Tax=Penicillium oxalicum TaxID=69781 RepID=UPI0020B8FD3B|nr:hypothetical protein POX_a00413 [Penicillium oxalicum]KAI2793826.1 hypothetical protein POX_a00413 [Penicillium oxalicum]